jgi:hypothetical protein
MKEQTSRSLKKKLWGIFSLYIRTRDCFRTTGTSSFALCITCERRYHIKTLQAGHFISGRHNANLFSEKGTHAQCYNCNINLRGNALEYRRKIIELYGEGYDLVLEKENRQTLQFTVPMLLKMIEEYKEKLKQLNNNTKGDSV